MRAVLIILSATLVVLVTSTAVTATDQTHTAIQVFAATVPALHRAALATVQAYGLAMVSDNVGAAGGEMVAEGGDTRVSIRLRRLRSGRVLVAVTAVSIDQARRWVEQIGETWRQSRPEPE